MNEPQAPEELKISKRPVIQEKVEEQKAKIGSKFPQDSEAIKNQFARDKVAASLRGEKQREETRKAIEASIKDPLTGLHNRRWFEDQLNIKTVEALRRGNPLWLVTFDIDNFKEFNSQYGHDGGDNVLKLIATLPAREEEPIARMGEGSDEFGELLDEEINEEQIVTVINRYVASMKTQSEALLKNAKPIKEVPDEELAKRVNLSFGITKYIPGEDHLAFKNRANLALHEAKNTGRNRTVIGEASGEDIIYRTVPVSI